MTTVPRRPLAETLVELLEGLAPDRAAAGGIRLARVAFDLPLEVRLDGRGDDAVLFGNVRRWRWPTDFDERPSRLAAHFHVTSIAER